jgi:hypothetical protein
MNTKIFLMMAALAVFTASSCNKDQTLIDQTSVDLADDDAVSDAIFEDIFSTVDNASIIAESIKGDESKSETVVTDSCPSVKINRPTGAAWPKTITVDYGTGCSGFDGNTRSGMIVISVTGPRLETGSKRSVTFESYYSNGIKVEGTKVLENLGKNTNQNFVFSIKLTSGKLTLADGKTILREFDHKREWIAGIFTKNIFDDECLVSGIASGVNINGIAYTNTIMTPLHWTRACKFIVSGVVKIERSGKEPVTIDYGDGECDARATVTKGGVSKEILLSYRYRPWTRN